MNFKRVIPLGILLGGAAFVLAFGNPLAIDWSFPGAPRFHNPISGEIRETGFGNDGRLYWRSIMMATNSPAEAPPALPASAYTQQLDRATNYFYVVTNATASSLPAKVRQPGYTSPPPLPGGTNRPYPPITP